MERFESLNAIVKEFQFKRRSLELFGVTDFDDYEDIDESEFPISSDLRMPLLAHQGGFLDYKNEMSRSLKRMPLFHSLSDVKIPSDKVSISCERTQTTSLLSSSPPKIFSFNDYYTQATQLQPRNIAGHNFDDDFVPQLNLSTTGKHKRSICTARVACLKSPVLANHPGPAKLFKKLTTDFNSEALLHHTPSSLSKLGFLGDDIVISFDSIIAPLELDRPSSESKLPVSTAMLASSTCDFRDSYNLQISSRWDGFLTLPMSKSRPKSCCSNMEQPPLLSSGLIFTSDFLVYDTT